MIKIRNNCFETNSSSAHSFITTKDDRHVEIKELVIGEEYPDNIEFVYLGREGKLRLYNMDRGFGRYPFRFLLSFEDKLKYAMCEFLGHLYTDDPEWQYYYDMFREIAHEVVPEFVDFQLIQKKKIFISTRMETKSCIRI